MVLHRSGPLPNPDGLAAQGRYSEAVDAFQAQLRDRNATLAERLRLADELVRCGLANRALEALRRADAIAPGHREVRDRFAALARASQARTAAARRLADEKTDPYMKNAVAGVRARPGVPAGPEALVSGASIAGRTPRARSWSARGIRGTASS